MLLNKQKIKDNLSNFYKEYGFVDADVDFFVDLYDEMGQAVLSYLEAVRRNQTILSMEVFRKYNFAAFRSYSACYKIEELLIDPVSAALAGVSGDLQTRVNQWNTVVSNENKIKFLTSRGKYIQLSAKRVLDIVEPNVISLELYDSRKRELALGRDYLFFENKIFLINEFARPTAANTDLIAINIFVDYNTPSALVGSRIGIGYTEEISKPEYKDFLQMVAHVLIKGPTIRNIKDAFNILAGWENSNVVDMISATGVRKELWHNPVTAILTPFDFLITIPASAATTVGLDDDGLMVAKDDRFQILKGFINIVKPTDTAYILALSEIISELISPDDIIDVNITFETEDDTAPAGEEFDAPILNVTTEEFEHGDLLRKIFYDTEGHYDDGKSYDKDSLVPVSEKPMFGDILSINHIEYPQYPVSFNAVRDILSGNVVVTFVDSAENVEFYEVFRNSTLIHTVPVPGSGNAIQYVDTAIAGMGSGTYVYYAVSTYMIGAVKHSSRPSKQITIIK